MTLPHKNPLMKNLPWPPFNWSFQSGKQYPSLADKLLANSLEDSGINKELKKIVDEVFDEFEKSGVFKNIKPDSKETYTSAYADALKAYENSKQALENVVMSTKPANIPNNPAPLPKEEDTMELKDIQETVKRLTSDCDTLQELLIEKENSLHERVDNTHERIDEAQERLDEVESKLSTRLSDVADQASDDCDDLEEKLNRVEESLNERADHNLQFAESLHETVAALEEKVSTKYDVEQLANEVRELSEARSKDNATLNSVNEQIGQRLTSLQHTTNFHNKTLDEIEQRITNLSALAQRVNDLESLLIGMTRGQANIKENVKYIEELLATKLEQRDIANMKTTLKTISDSLPFRLAVEQVGTGDHVWSKATGEGPWFVIGPAQVEIGVNTSNENLNDVSRVAGFIVKDTNGKEWAKPASELTRIKPEAWAHNLLEKKIAQEVAKTHAESVWNNWTTLATHATSVKKFTNPRPAFTAIKKAGWRKIGKVVLLTGMALGSLGGSSVITWKLASRVFGHQTPTVAVNK